MLVVNCLTEIWIRNPEEQVAFTIIAYALTIVAIKVYYALYGEW